MCKMTDVVPYFWRAKVKNQGVGMVTLPPETPGDDPSHLFHLLGGSHGLPGSPWACGRLPPVSASIFTWPLPSLCI